MFKHYRGLWAILALAFVAFALFSFFGPVTIAGHEFKTSKLAQSLMAPAENAEQTGDAASAGVVAEEVKKAAEPVPVDTAQKTMLFIGDSMLDGLSPRLAAYAKENGHKLYTVIWYSSTSEIWGRSDKIKQYITRVNPDYIFICLGANELFVKDIKDKRERYVKKMVQDFGDIPFLWIGPPNWKPDTGINELIEANVPRGSYFESNGMKFDRAKDGAHPTHASAIEWMDSVVRWMPTHSNHPIRMDIPAEKTARPARVFVHQPSER